MHGFFINPAEAWNMTNKKVALSFSAFWTILKNAFKRLGRNDPTHLAGATSFFATFSLAPLFFILVQVLGALIGKNEIEKNVVQRFAENAPKESISQLKQFLEGLEKLQGSWLANAALFLFLVLSAAKLFVIIRISLYRLWRLKSVHEKALAFKFKTWLFPLVLIISAGALLLAGLLIQTFQAGLGETVAEVSSSAWWHFNRAYRYLISVVVAWVWFAVVFRYLTDARPQWRTVVVGALFTSVLFNLGKLVLQPTLSMGKVHAVFGTSASLVMLQLFVFYISLLIYLGAAFTIEWAKYFGQPITLADHLRYYTIEEKESKEDVE